MTLTRVVFLPTCFVVFCCCWWLGVVAAPLPLRRDCLVPLVDVNEAVPLPTATGDLGDASRALTVQALTLRDGATVLRGARFGSSDTNSSSYVVRLSVAIFDASALATLFGSSVQSALRFVNSDCAIASSMDAVLARASRIAVGDLRADMKPLFGNLSFDGVALPLHDSAELLVALMLDGWRVDSGTAVTAALDECRAAAVTPMTCRNDLANFTDYSCGRWNMSLPVDLTGGWTCVGEEVLPPPPPAANQSTSSSPLLVVMLSTPQSRGSGASDVTYGAPLWLYWNAVPTAPCAATTDEWLACMPPPSLRGEGALRTTIDRRHMWRNLTEAPVGTPSS